MTPGRRSSIGDFRDLEACQVSMELGKAVYSATRSFPSDETCGLRMQLRRAAVSIPSNIAEGFGRGSRQDYIRFVRMARGSVFELETQIAFAQALLYLDADAAAHLMDLAGQVARLLHGLVRALQLGEGSPGA